MCPTSTISSRGFARAAQAAGRGDIRIPAPAATWSQSNQFDTAYHEHYSYLSLTAVAQSSRRNGLRGVRRRGAADAWRQPAGVRPAQRHAADRRTSPRWPALLAREAAAGMRRPDFYSGFQAARGAREGRVARLPIDGQARRASGRRLRRGGQGQHAAQLRRHPPGPARVRGRSQPGQAGAVHAGQPHPDRGRRHARDERPDYSS